MAREGSIFDELARGLADGSVTRGKALKLMGSAFLGAALASVPGVAWAACPTGQTRCGERCVDLQTNERHCGSCRNRCGSAQTCCQGRCINLKRSERHCGSCFNRCPEGSECVDGVCQCPSGTTLCGGACVSNVCPQGQDFNPSACQCEAVTICPDTCCCSCTYEDSATGQQTVVCNSGSTATTPIECHEMCGANVPLGKSLLASGFGCTGDQGPNTRFVCGPVSGPNITGLACFFTAC